MRSSLLVAAGITGFFALACNGAAPTPDPTIRDAMAKVKPLFQIKGKPRPGEWLEK